MTTSTPAGAAASTPTFLPPRAAAGPDVATPPPTRTPEPPDDQKPDHKERAEDKSEKKAGGKGERLRATAPFDYDTNPVTVAAHAARTIGKPGGPPWKDQKKKRVAAGDTVELSAIPAQSREWMVREFHLVDEDAYNALEAASRETGLGIDVLANALAAKALEAERLTGGAAKGGRASTLEALLTEYLEVDHVRAE